MKKINQLILTALFLLALSFQNIQAGPLSTNVVNEKAGSNASNEVSELLSEDNLDSALELNNSIHLSTSESSAISMSELSLISKVDFETELELEDWMSDIEGDTWNITVEKEQDIELENWMVNPTGWLP